MENSYRRFAFINVAILIVSGLLLVWLSRNGTLDFWLTQEFFDPATHSFPLKNAPYLVFFGHTVLKDFTVLLLVLAIALSVASARFDFLRPWRQPLVMFCLMAACASLLVSELKHESVHACPWDLAMYGGQALWHPLFSWVSPSVELGRCWPGGHASGGFAIIAGYFALRQQRPVWGRYFLVAGLLMGSIMGSVQVVRGAHFLSHNLWTLWIVWSTCFAIDVVLHTVRFIRTPASQYEIWLSQGENIAWENRSAASE